MSGITLYPAIDLLGGKVVRLERGDRAKSKVYSDDPALIAGAFRFEGAQILHVVDLDAAFDGPAARQTKAIAAIVEAARGLPVQLGGGLRDFDTISQAFDMGIARVLLGTAAVEDRDLLRRALEKFGPLHVAVAADEKDGLVKTRGWVDAAGGLKATDFARSLAEDGVRVFLHSAIARDGTMSGPDLEALRRIAETVAPLGGEVICAGGVGSLEHLRELRDAKIAGVAGAVAGRAIYEKAFTIQQARLLLAGQT